VEATYVQRASEDASTALRCETRHIEPRRCTRSWQCRHAFGLSSIGGDGEKASGFIRTLQSALLAAFDPFSDFAAGDPVAQLLRDSAAATQRGKCRRGHGGAQLLRHPRS